VRSLDPLEHLHILAREDRLHCGNRPPIAEKPEILDGLHPKAAVRITKRLDLQIKGLGATPAQPLENEKLTE
jgi:hypothetical protein